MVKWCFIFGKAQKSSLSQMIYVFATKIKFSNFRTFYLQIIYYKMLFFVYSIVALIIYLYFYIERMSFMEKIINWLRIVLAEEKSSKLTLNVLK